MGIRSARYVKRLYSVPRTEADMTVPRANQCQFPRQHLRRLLPDRIPPFIFILRPVPNYHSSQARHRQRLALSKCHRRPQPLLPRLIPLARLRRCQDSQQNRKEHHRRLRHRSPPAPLPLRQLTQCRRARADQDQERICGRRLRSSVGGRS